MHQKHTICVRTSTPQAISDWATITTVQQGKNTVKKLRKNIDIIYIPCKSPGPHPEGSLRGLAGGGVSRPTPRGGSWGVWLGGFQDHTQGGLQDHTQGGVSQHALRQPPPADSHCRGRYASYWNAFLFLSEYLTLTFVVAPTSAIATDISNSDVIK